MQPCIKTTEILEFSCGHVLQNTIDLESLLNIEHIYLHWRFRPLEQPFDASVYSLELFI